MRGFFHKIFENVAKIFWSRNLLWHFAAVALTYILVVSGFDWFYFQLTRGSALNAFLFPAVPIGAFASILLPFAALAAGKYKKNYKISNTAFALGQAALLGLATSDFYKFFTGRPGLPGFLTQDFTTDISHVFKFGILRGGIFFGWPSSHTTVAFAMAVTLFTLYPKNKLVRFLAIAYALYVGFGVSATIHWFSDFVAGVIIGSVIGVVVGRSFLVRYASNEDENRQDPH
jgi:membrane-associated phospholipid phosphatase